MSEKKIKLIMELIFIFIIPLIFICFTSKIQIERNFQYDNNGNYETSEDIKKLSFDNAIIKYTDSYKNVINNFNLWDEDWEIGGIVPGVLNSTNYIPCIPQTNYFIFIGSEKYPDIYYYDSEKNLISYISTIWNRTFTTPENCYYIRFRMAANYGIVYRNDICINLSVNWANGNYVPYGEPLILYTDTDVSGQNDINYTIWGNIKNLLIDSLQLNDNILLDIILSYTILWVTMFLIWHILYGLFELIFHVIPHGRRL